VAKDCVSELAAKAALGDEAARAAAEALLARRARSLRLRRGEGPVV